MPQCSSVTIVDTAAAPPPPAEEVEWRDGGYEMKGRRPNDLLLFCGGDI